MIMADGLELLASLCVLHGPGCAAGLGAFLGAAARVGHNKAPEAVIRQGLYYWTWEERMAVAVAVAAVVLQP